VNLPLRKDWCFLLSAAYEARFAGFFIFQNVVLSNTLEAVADSLDLSELAKSGARTC
jgi:hypothetical protein